MSTPSSSFEGTSGHVDVDGALLLLLDHLDQLGEIASVRWAALHARVLLTLHPQDGSCDARVGWSRLLFLLGGRGALVIVARWGEGARRIAAGVGVGIDAEALLVELHGEVAHGAWWSGWPIWRVMRVHGW